MKEKEQEKEQEREKDGSKKGISFFSITIIATLVGLLALVGWGLANNSGDRPQIGDEVPDLPLTFFSGYEWNGQTEATLSDMEGEIVVLNIWASWCIECVYEADDLENTWQAYADQGVIFLGVAYTDIDSESLAFLEEHEISYPNAPDIGGEIAKVFQLTLVPETIVIDKNGRVAAFTFGPIQAPDLAQLLDQLLEAE